MPAAASAAQKFNPDGSQHGQGSWLAVADSKNRGSKNPGFRFDGSGRSFQTESVKQHLDGRKGSGSWFGDYQGQKEGIKQGGDWFNASQPSISRMCSSKSKARKAASAKIAKIPLALSTWIGRCYLPKRDAA